MNLSDQLILRVEGVLSSEPFDPALSREVGDWFLEHFRINVNRTPPGSKEAKKRAESFAWWLRNASMYEPDVARAQLALEWAKVQPELPVLIRAFTSEGGADVPAELRVGGNTYWNPIGLTGASLAKYAARVEAILASLRGWRRGALKGGVDVVFAGPDSFRGTAKGFYRTSEDRLYIRAVPEVLKRGASYGGAEYIVVHELGHRYERKNATPNFDQPRWWTTRYSQNEGETFAELFALGHFGTVAQSGPVDPDILEQFEQAMTSRDSSVERVASRWMLRFSFGV